MSKVVYLIFVIFFSISIQSCYEGWDSYPDLIPGEIIPGTQMGGIYIGDTYKRVIELYGVSHGQDYFENENGAFIFCWWKDEGLGVTIEDTINNHYPDLNEIVFRIRAETPYRGALKYGTGIGSDKVNDKDYEMIMPCYINDDYYYYYKCSETGIYIGFTEDHSYGVRRIDRISIFKGEKNDK